MNEIDWDTETDPFKLLKELFPMRGLDSAPRQTRQTRLYAIACARRFLPSIVQPFVELTERLTLGEQNQPALRQAAFFFVEELINSRGITEHIEDLQEKASSIGLAGNSIDELQSALDEKNWESITQLMYFPFMRVVPPFTRVSNGYHSVELIREVFCNPVHPVYFEREWLDRNVVGLARSMYDSRVFSSMPILADALQDAGCENEQVLDHCREPREHIRGCWVLEGILYRSDKR